MQLGLSFVMVFFSSCVPPIVSTSWHVPPQSNFPGKAEGWISPAQIDEPNHHLNEHNQMVSELARARQCLVLSRQRVSRFSMWAGFSEKAVGRACAEVVADDGLECKVLQAITSFRPSCLRVATDDGQSRRQYQLAAWNFKLTYFSQ